MDKVLDVVDWVLRLAQIGTSVVLIVLISRMLRGGKQR